MREAARFGRGSHTHIGSLDEVADKMAALFAQLSQAAAVNLDVAWPATGGAGQVEAWPERLPDLYLGQPLLVSVSFGASAPLGEVVVSGDIAGQPWRQALQLASAPGSDHAREHKGVASLWARAKITGLLDQLVLGRSEETVRAQVLPIALQHQLLSPYTSFVAVEDVISLPAGEQATSVPVPNTRPQGQAPQFFAYPRTATTGPAMAWLGMLLLFIATLVRVMRQPETDRVPTDER
jgi:Ca-activated chloride channel family protein